MWCNITNAEWNQHDLPYELSMVGLMATLFTLPVLIRFIPMYITLTVLLFTTINVILVYECVTNKSTTLYTMSITILAHGLWLYSRGVSDTLPLIGLMMATVSTMMIAELPTYIAISMITVTFISSIILITPVVKSKIIPYIINAL